MAFPSGTWEREKRENEGSKSRRDVLALLESLPGFPQGAALRMTSFLDAAAARQSRISMRLREYDARPRFPNRRGVLRSRPFSYGQQHHRPEPP